MHAGQREETVSLLQSNRLHARWQEFDGLHALGEQKRSRAFCVDDVAFDSQSLAVGLQNRAGKLIAIAQVTLCLLGSNARRHYDVSRRKALLCFDRLI